MRKITKSLKVLLLMLLVFQQVISVEAATLGKATASIELTKVDKEDYSIVLPEAEFKLLNESDKVIEKKLKTNKMGKIMISNLPEGKYKLVETKAPKGYVLDEAPVVFEIKNEMPTEVIKLKKEN
ncbi:TPA: collagen binding domain-containing protein, partial [Bacillus cereus]